MNGPVPATEVNVRFADVPTQMVCVPVNNAFGRALIVSVLVAVALEHPLLPVAVKVNVTEPAKRSDALGVYDELETVLVALKLPDPLEDHDVEAAFEALAPVTTLTLPPFKHMDTAVPDDALGAVFTVTVAVVEHPVFAV